jgi:rhodanese-related sulfurtransferase
MMLVMSDTLRNAPTIEAADVAKHIEQNDVFLLDLRGGTGNKQIYGAIRYDPGKLAQAERLVLPLPKSGSGLIVLYDEDGKSRELQKLAEKLTANGYDPVHVLAGGFKAWEASGGRTEEPTIEQPVPLVSEHQLER